MSNRGSRHAVDRSSDNAQSGAVPRLTRREIKRQRLDDYRAEIAAKAVLLRAKLVDEIADDIVSVLQTECNDGSVDAVDRPALLGRLHHEFKVKTRNTRHHVDHPERLLSDALTQLCQQGTVWRTDKPSYQISTDVQVHTVVVTERGWDQLEQLVPRRQRRLLECEGY